MVARNAEWLCEITKRASGEGYADGSIKLTESLLNVHKISDVWVILLISLLSPGKRRQPPCGLVSL